MRGRVRAGAQTLLPTFKRGPAGGARLQHGRSLKKRGRLSKGFGRRIPSFCGWSPIIPLSTGVPAFPKPLTRRTFNPSQAATERPSRKAKAQGGFPEARTAQNESRFACWRDGCRDLRVPRKACQRRRRTDAAMKAGKNLRWHAGRRLACWRDGCRRGRGKRANADGGPMLAMKAVKPSMARWAKPARVEISVVWNGRCPSGGDWQDRQNQGRPGATTLRKLLPRLVPDLTGRRWERSQRRLSFRVRLPSRLHANAVPLMFSRHSRKPSNLP